MADIQKVDSRWIGCKSGNGNENKIFLFRRSFQLEEDSVSLFARVSADSRYKLYLNGALVSFGPCKGTIWNTYYEKVDVTPYLKKGTNVLAAEVFHFINDRVSLGNNIGPCAIERTGKAAFLLDGVLLDRDGNMIEDLSTNESWKVKEDESIEFIPSSYSIYAAAYEHVDFKLSEIGWKDADFRDRLWSSAQVLINSYIDSKSADPYGQLTPWPLKERPIPQLSRIEKRFTGVTRTGYDKNAVINFLKGKDKLKLLPGTCTYFELNAGELTTGYINLKASGGKGSTIKILYSECYEEYIDGEYKKGIRDNTSGVLRGDSDMLELSGERVEYETFWFRPFRFVRIEISTGEQELHLCDINYKETGYPLDIVGNFKSSDESHSLLWDISLRTLKRCMHETFEDCPYYEQLQYAMDSRLQMLFSYQLSKDDNLARKCIDDFHNSLNSDGLLQSRYPSVIRQIIPGFCLHWIFMLEDYIMYFGDLEFVKKYRPTVDAVLGWFDIMINEQGLVGRTGYWAFVDWVQGWERGVPNAGKNGPITVYSMMYAKALQAAAFVNEATGRKGIAEEYLERSEKIKEAVKKYCYDDDRKLFKDGPECSEFSQHPQVWAVVSGVVEGSEARELMLKALDEDMSKVSYAMAFYLFRAIEATNLYDRADELLNIWRGLADKKMTTWVEDPVSERSECHGWGSLPLYEFPVKVLGVRPADTGYGKIHIEPYTGKLSHAEGTVSTAKGPVTVEWHIENDTFYIDITSPDGVIKEVVLPDGSIYSLADSQISLSCSLKG